MYEGGTLPLAGAFSQRPAEVIPETLKPLRYCEYRVMRLDEPPEVCATFAMAEIEQMSFCLAHGRTVQHGLSQEGPDGG